MNKSNLGLTVSELQDIIQNVQTEGVKVDLVSLALAVQGTILNKVKTSSIRRFDPPIRKQSAVQVEVPHFIKPLIGRQDYLDLKTFSDCKSHRLVNSVSYFRMDCMATLGLVRKLRAHHFEITDIGRAVLTEGLSAFVDDEVEVSANPLAAPKAGVSNKANSKRADFGLDLVRVNGFVGKTSSAHDRNSPSCGEKQFQSF